MIDRANIEKLRQRFINVARHFPQSMSSFSKTIGISQATLAKFVRGLWKKADFGVILQIETFIIEKEKEIDENNLSPRYASPTYKSARGNGPRRKPKTSA